MNIQWESEKYKNDFAFVHQYGESVLQLIESGEDFEQRFYLTVPHHKKENMVWQIG